MTSATCTLRPKLILLYLFQVTEISSQNNFHLAFTHKTIIQKLYHHIISIAIWIQRTCFNKLLDLLLALDNNGKSKKLTAGKI